MVKKALEYLKIVESFDTRQQGKVLHKLNKKRFMICCEPKKYFDKLLDL